MRGEGARPAAPAGLLAAALALAACRAAAPADEMAAMNRVAERYVRLVLALGRHDADYVDAYYGPPAWRVEAEAGTMPLADIGREADTLAADLQELDAPPARGDEREADLVALRRDYLTRQLQALRARVEMLSGATLTFDQESRALYDAVAPTRPEADFQAILEELEPRLPGGGPLVERYEAFRRDFVVRADRLGAVFDAAIAECRRRTLAHVELPPAERFTIEYVTGKSWSGYNWYQGGYRSLIQINTDFPIYIDRAVDLACHEGYPGHHVYNVLLERHLVQGRGWPEFTVYALFTPQSLIAEGTANYGIEVAFPAGERLEFERRVLFPAAGIEAGRAEEYDAVQALVDRLAYAGNEAARQYLDGAIDRKAAAEWLARFAMMPPARAEQRTRFFDQYRSYVINYNLGKDLVRRHVESRAGAGGPEGRWREFVALLSSPRLPSGLTR